MKIFSPYQLINPTIKKNGLLLLLLCTSFTFAQQTVDLDDKDDINEKVSQLYKKGDWNTAKTWLDKAIKKYPNDPEFRMLLGKYYIEKKQYPKARYELNKSLSIKPTNTDSKRLLLHVETESKRYSSAIAYVNELLQSSPYSKELWRKKINLYREQGNVSEADRLLKRLAEIFPEDPTILKDVGYQTELAFQEKRKLGQLDDVIELNKDLLKLNPKNLGYHLDLINNYIKIGDYSNALAITERGLNQFPRNLELVKKKISLFDQSQQYDAGLAYINQQLKLNSSDYLRQQYSYFLTEAAQSAKNNDTAILFGKIFEKNAGDTEAFAIVYHQLVSQQQYDEALATLQRHRKAKGNSRDMDFKELALYKAKGDVNKTKSFTRKLYATYPSDIDLKAAYVQIIAEEARDAMQNTDYNLAIDQWKIVQRYGDNEQQNLAQNGLYNAYLQMGNYREAELMLNQLLVKQPKQGNLFFKKAELYYQQNRINEALTAYEDGLKQLQIDQKFYALSGYEELMVKAIKESAEKYAYPTALSYTERWLVQDPLNQQALLYAINFTGAMNDWVEMKKYAQIASNAYTADTHFKLKLAEALQFGENNYEEALALIQSETIANPYHEKASNAYSESVARYSEQLLKEKDAEKVIELTSNALYLNPKNKEIKYLKGLAYEQQKKYDSAYYYQQHYEPTLMEVPAFRQHLNYLYHKGLKNEIGITHARSRFGDDVSIQTTTSLEYTRIGEDNHWTGRVNYTGRSGGQGVQGIVEWNKTWDNRWSSQVSLGGANDYFPKIVANASMTYLFDKNWEVEGGLGYRKLPTDENLFNLLMSATKEFDDFRVNAKLNQFSLESKWLYNLTLSGKYAMGSPKNYLLFLAGIGSSPDVDLIDLQNLNTFSITNTQVGAGIGRLLTKNISANLLGTWYNFKNQKNIPLYGDENSPTPTEIQTILNYRNFYTLYFQINVSF